MLVIIRYVIKLEKIGESIISRNLKSNKAHILQDLVFFMNVSSVREISYMGAHSK